ncbi:MAG: EI24 domain-containing protein [Spirulinaceae cyanobacterium]
MIRRLVSGATYPLRALNLVRRSPRLLQFFIIPWLVNAVVGGILYTSLFLPTWRGLRLFIQFLEQQVNAWLLQLPAWLRFIEAVVLFFAHVVQWGLMLGLLLLIGTLVLQFGTLIGSPWYGKLSEEIERTQLGAIQTVEVSILTDLGRALLFEVKKMLLWCSVAIALLLLNGLPGLGTAIATLGWMTLTGLIACLDFLDGPSERRRLRFRQKLKIAVQALPASASFSLVCCVLLSIPLVNLLTIPLCVTAGTLFWCDYVFPHFPPQPLPRTRQSLIPETTED